MSEETYKTTIIGGATIVELDRPPLPPPSWADVALDPRYHWIETGVWRARFGMDWAAMLMSDHKVCRMATSVWADSKYIDLKDPRNGQILDALIATAQPAADALAAGSGPITLTKKASLLDEETTEAERYIKGMEQPQ